MKKRDVFRISISSANIFPRARPLQQNFQCASHDRFVLSCHRAVSVTLSRSRPRRADVTNDAIARDAWLANGDAGVGHVSNFSINKWASRDRTISTSRARCKIASLFTIKKYSESLDSSKLCDVRY